MPYQQFTDGLYLLKQKSEGKGIDHYGIMDVGNRIAHPQVSGQQPIVIHQTPPTIKLEWLQETGTWEVLAHITDEEDAKARMAEAFKNSTYDLFGHNCEHFARYVATGRRESIQLQAVGVMAGLAALAYYSGR